MIDDPAQDLFYSDLIRVVLQIESGTNRALDNDEYLELMTVFVQSIRYETTSEKSAEIPR